MQLSAKTQRFLGVFGLRNNRPKRDRRRRFLMRRAQLRGRAGC